MGSKRRNHTSKFKAKVALEAVRGVHTASELSSKYGVYANMIAKWKRQLLEGASDVFEPGRTKASKADADALTAPLYQEIGRLKMEVDFLEKKC
jgi:putative transposase